MSDDPLDALATRLRDRLLREAADSEGTDAAAQIRALVDREAAMLGAEARDELVRRVAERSFGLGPLEALLADPEVDEVVVNGAGAGEAHVGRLHPPRSAGGSTSPSRCATRGSVTGRGSTSCCRRWPWTGRR